MWWGGFVREENKKCLRGYLPRGIQCFLSLSLCRWLILMTCLMTVMLECLHTPMIDIRYKRWINDEPCYSGRGEEICWSPLQDVGQAGPRVRQPQSGPYQPTLYLSLSALCSVTSLWSSSVWRPGAVLGRDHTWSSGSVIWTERAESPSNTSLQFLRASAS